MLLSFLILIIIKKTSGEKLINTDAIMIMRKTFLFMNYFVSKKKKFIRRKIKTCRYYAC